MPDYVADAGGIISVMAEYFGQSANLVQRRVDLIADRVREILGDASAARRPANEVADKMGRDIMARKRVRASA